MGRSDGPSVGSNEGLCEGDAVGSKEGLCEGDAVGSDEGLCEGDAVGSDEGLSDGLVVGASEGEAEGSSVGWEVGNSVEEVGYCVMTGARVGSLVGMQIRLSVDPSPVMTKLSISKLSLLFDSLPFSLAQMRVCIQEVPSI